MRRADDGQPFDLAPVEQFAGNQPRFDGLADAHIIGNQQPDDVLAQGHEQRHELIRPRLDGQVAEAAERASPGAEPEPQGVAHEQTRGLGAGFRRVRAGKGGRFRRDRFQRQIDHGRVVLAAAQRPEGEHLVAGLRAGPPIPARGL